MDYFVAIVVGVAILAIVWAFLRNDRGTPITDDDACNFGAMSSMTAAGMTTPVTVAAMAMAVNDELARIRAQIGDGLAAAVDDDTAESISVSEVRGSLVETLPGSDEPLTIMEPDQRYTAPLDIGYEEPERSYTVPISIEEPETVCSSDDE